MYVVGLKKSYCAVLAFLTERKHPVASLADPKSRHHHSCTSGPLLSKIRRLEHSPRGNRDGRSVSTVRGARTVWGRRTERRFTVHVAEAGRCETSSRWTHRGAQFTAYKCLLLECSVYHSQTAVAMGSETADEGGLLYLLLEPCEV